MNSNKYFIGLSSTFHDSAIAIVDRHGKIIFCEANERYQQNKRAIFSMPDDLLRLDSLFKKYCETPSEMHIAKTWSNDSNKILNREVRYCNNILADSNDAQMSRLVELYRHVLNSQMGYHGRIGYNIISYCQFQTKIQSSITGYDHHLTHAATSLFTSPFKDAVAAVIDGMGEGTAMSFYRYKNGAIKKINKSKTTGLCSLGLFYSSVLCRLCGFQGIKGEEWKVMGLAAYGKLNEDLLGYMEKFMSVDDLNIRYLSEAEEALTKILSFSRRPGQPAIEMADVAYTGQHFFSTLMLKVLDNLYRRGISDNLALGGGCALNSTTNGIILNKTKFKKLYVPSAPADDGNAIGAALLNFQEENKDYLPDGNFCSPYLGSEVSEETLAHLCQFNDNLNIKSYPEDELIKMVAALLVEGKILGWFQGRAEFGPRSLGNRSILADPRDRDMKKKINSLIKFREEFRPFAPSILHEYGDDYFEGYSDTPYMEKTLQFKKSVVDIVPGVVHSDGTGRLQSVKREWNPLYYSLIEEFRKRTGVPILLNTSLNIMGKPIVHSLEDAVALLFTTGLHALVVKNYLIVK